MHSKEQISFAYYKTFKETVSVLWIVMQPKIFCSCMIRTYKTVGTFSKEIKEGKHEVLFLAIFQRHDGTSWWQISNILKLQSFSYAVQSLRFSFSKYFSAKKENLRSSLTVANFLCLTKRYKIWHTTRIIWCYPSFSLSISEQLLDRYW